MFDLKIIIEKDMEIPWKILLFELLWLKNIYFYHVPKNKNLYLKHVKRHNVYTTSKQSLGTSRFQHDEAEHSL